MQVPRRSQIVACTAVTGLVLVGSLALGSSDAVAAPAVAVSLDGFDFVHLRQFDQLGPIAVDDPLAIATPTPIDAAWGGSVTFELPVLLDLHPTQAMLELYPSLDGIGASPDQPNPVTRTYDSTSPVPADQITFTDLGAGRFQVDLPADDGVNGPYGLLRIGYLDSPNFPVGAYFGGRDIFAHLLDLSGGDAAVTLTPQARLVTNADHESETVAAGGQLAVSLPATSEYTSFGFTSLVPSTFTLLPADDTHRPSGDPGISLAPTYGGDGRSALLTVPAGTAAGGYVLVTVVGAGSDQYVVSHSTSLTVAAVNDGLLVDTGGPESSGISPVLPVAAAGVALVLALGLRFRRTIRPE